MRCADMMQFLCCLLVLVAGVTGFDRGLDERWESFKRDNSRNYKTIGVEDHRRGIWEDKIKEIEQHNIEEQEGKHSYTMQPTEWDDLTYEEFMHGDKDVVNEMSRDKRASKNGTGDCFNENSWNDTFPYNFTSVASLPTNVDWSQKGYVTPVKNQGSCGSCWAFAAVGSIEGQWYRKTGKLDSLSPQFLVDCSKSNSGCNGGLPSRAFEDVVTKKGIPSEKNYKYVAKQQPCKKFTIAASIKGYKNINTRQELQNAVAYIGPISVGIKTGPKITNVGKGVFTDCTGQINHAVLVVGYGVINGKDVWKIKNSWGPSWGNKGYFYMTRGGSSDCGIYSFASYPTVDGTTRGSNTNGEVADLGAVVGGSGYIRGSLSVLATAICLLLGLQKISY